MTPYSLEFAGLEWTIKIQNLRENLKENEYDAMVISEHVCIVLYICKESLIQNLYNNMCKLMALFGEGRP